MSSISLLAVWLAGWLERLWLWLAGWRLWLAGWLTRTKETKGQRVEVPLARHSSGHFVFLGGLHSFFVFIVSPFGFFGFFGFYVWFLGVHVGPCWVLCVLLLLPCVFSPM